MSKGSPEIMRQASQRLAEITDLVEIGEGEMRVSMPLNEAALVLRMPAEILRTMGKRRQELGISVRDSRVDVTLHGGVRERRSGYQFLYGLLQGVNPETAAIFLETQSAPRNLLNEIPGLQATIEVIERGTDTLPSEDLRFLHIYLWGYWLSLQDRTNLPDPANLFASF